MTISRMWAGWLCFSGARAMVFLGFSGKTGIPFKVIAETAGR
jgi:hypothetical protein